MSDNNETPEVTVESLQALVETAKADLANEKTDHETTKSDLALALGALTDAGEIIEGQKEVIATQEAQIVALQTSPLEYPVIEVSKVKYEVRAKSFKYKGEVITVEKLLADKALQKELIGKGVGFIVKLEA